MKLRVLISREFASFNVFLCFMYSLFQIIFCIMMRLANFENFGHDMRFLIVKVFVNIFNLTLERAINFILQNKF